MILCVVLAMLNDIKSKRKKIKRNRIREKLLRLYSEDELTKLNFNCFVSKNLKRLNKIPLLRVEKSLIKNKSYKNEDSDDICVICQDDID